MANDGDVVEYAKLRDTSVVVRVPSYRMVADHVLLGDTDDRQDKGKQAGSALARAAPAPERVCWGGG
jgi:hypothetical protein